MSAAAAAGVKAKAETVVAGTELAGVLAVSNKLMPRSADFAEGIEKEMVSLAFAPT